MRLRTAVVFLTCAAALAATPATHAQILFVADYSTEGAAEGFNDPTATTVNGNPTTFGLARRSAFQTTLSLIGNIFSPRFAGESVIVRAEFNPLGGTAGGAVLASAGPTTILRDFAGAPVANTFYPIALASHRAGSRQNGANPDIFIQFNSDVDNNVVLGNTNWYYGTNRTPGSNIDMITTAMHEIGHGLGFISNLLTDGSYNNGFPSIWDNFMNTSQTGGAKLRNSTQAVRLGETTGNDLWWDGPLGIAGNGGNRPRLYAPNPFEPGSSLSHTDETTHASDLMSPFDSGPADFSVMDRGMLQDMGWTPIPEPTSMALVAATAAFGTALQRRRSKKAAA